MGDEDLVSLDREEDPVFPIAVAIEELADFRGDQAKTGFRSDGAAPWQLGKSLQGRDETFISPVRRLGIGFGNPMPGFLDVVAGFCGQNNGGRKRASGSFLRAGEFSPHAFVEIIERCGAAVFEVLQSAGDGGGGFVEFQTV